MKKALALFLSCAAFAAPALRAQPAVVEAVQYPAWLERGGRLVPLAPGVALQARDGIRTGGNARVQLRLGEGSAVKLGENARFKVERVQDRGLFRAALHVVNGAFRFTTDALTGNRPREISIKVRNVTAGVRGTDLWGKSTEERDLVCLLEGRITVGSGDQPEVTLDEPRAFYQRPRGGSPQVGSVDAKQVEEWSRETEISANGAAGRVGGRWRVIAAKYETRDRALALSRRLREAGYPSEAIGPRDGIHTVQITGLAGEVQARALMADIRAIPGITIPAVSEMPVSMR